MDYGQVFIVLACILGLIMAFGVGANDVANAMSTSVGAGVLTLRRAVIVAAVFEFAGAYLAGGEVTSTIRSGIVDTSDFAAEPQLFVLGMLAALFAAGLWLLIATHFGWPVSTTHSIVGAITGFAIAGVGAEAVHWGRMGGIVSSWVVSPLLAGTAAYLIYRSVQALILQTADPLKNAIRYVPVYIFLTAFIISLVTLLKGLKHVGLEVTTLQSYGLAALVGAVVMVGGTIVIRRMRFDPAADRRFHFSNVERVFSVLMVCTACSMAFAHGSNDVANAIGPVAAVLSVVESGGVVAQKSAVANWVLLLGAVGIVLGVLTFGRPVMATVGKKITELTASRGFSAELAAAGTVVFASGAGLPISTTHTLVGAVLGVGLARGIASLNLDVVRIIFMSWVITVPAGALLSILAFWVLQLVFG